MAFAGNADIQWYAICLMKIVFRTTHVFAIVMVTVLIPVRPGDALETDQFTTPPRPLKDFAPILQAHVTEHLARIIETANGNRQILLRDAENAPLGVLRRMLQDRADEVLNPDYVAQRLFEDLGPGLPECIIEEWAVQTSKRPGYQFAPNIDDSIYGTFFQRPIMLQVLSPTINVYGIYLGTDKIGHFFQQGHDYYEVYRDGEKRGWTPGQSTYAAVEVGVAQEHGLYGEGFDSVYSNADLATNFAGLHFYLNLTRPVEIRGTVRPPILVLNNGRWEFNPKADPEFLRVFFSDHMNESMNTCRYMENIRGRVKSAVAERGARWAEFYHTTYEQQARRAYELMTWYGQDYGHSGMRGVFTAADVCFQQPSAPRLSAPIAAVPSHRS